jgi:hypothetical protein
VLNFEVRSESEARNGQTKLSVSDLETCDIFKGEGKDTARRETETNAMGRGASTLICLPFLSWIGKGVKLKIVPWVRKGKKMRRTDG